MADTYRPLNAAGPGGDRDRPRSDSPQPEWVPARELPGAAVFVAAGFEPLEELTGVTWIGEEWPGEHRRSLSGSRPDDSAPGPVWFVRSPWPSLTAARAISLLWAQLPRENENAWPATIRAVLSRSEEWARETAGLLPPDEPF